MQGRSRRLSSRLRRSPSAASAATARGAGGHCHRAAHDGRAMDSAEVRERAGGRKRPLERARGLLRRTRSAVVERDAVQRRAGRPRPGHRRIQRNARGSSEKRSRCRLSRRCHRRRRRLWVRWGSPTRRRRHLRRRPDPVPEATTVHAYHPPEARTRDKAEGSFIPGLESEVLKGRNGFVRAELPPHLADGAGHVATAQGGTKRRQSADLHCAKGVTRRGAPCLGTRTRVLLCASSTPVASPRASRARPSNASPAPSRSRLPPSPTGTSSAGRTPMAFWSRQTRRGSRVWAPTRRCWRSAGASGTRGWRCWPGG